MTIILIQFFSFGNILLQTKKEEDSCTSFLPSVDFLFSFWSFENSDYYKHSIIWTIFYNGSLSRPASDHQELRLRSNIILFNTFLAKNAVLAAFSFFFFAFHSWEGMPGRNDIYDIGRSHTVLDGKLRPNTGALWRSFVEQTSKNSRGNESSIYPYSFPRKSEIHGGGLVQWILDRSNTQIWTYWPLQIKSFLGSPVIVFGSTGWT